MSELTTITHSLTPVASVRLFRQLDSIRVLPFPFVLLGKNLFEPMRLTLSDCLIHKCRIVEDDKSLTAIVAAKSTHLCKGGRTLSRLTFLYSYCSHRLLHSIGTLRRSLLRFDHNECNRGFFTNRLDLTAMA